MIKKGNQAVYKDLDSYNGMRDRTPTLEQALVGKDAPKAKTGRHLTDKKLGGAPTGRKERGRLEEKTMISRRRTVRQRVDRRVSQTQTLKREQAIEVSSCGCTSHKDTITDGIVNHTGWQIGAR